MVKEIATTLINNHSYAFLLLNKTNSDNPYPSTVVVHVVATVPGTVPDRSQAGISSGFDIVSR